jgi:hypothetical protein
MHVLPFVSILLIILTTISYSFLDKSKTIIYEKQMMLSHMNIERKLLRKLHREAFKKAPKKKSSSQHSRAQGEPPKRVDSALTPRTHSVSKMNLFPLFSEKMPSEVIDLLKNLLNALYARSFLAQHNSSSFSHLSTHLLTKGREKIELVKTLQQDPDSLHFYELYPDEPSAHALFYKILKGTHSYDLIEKGYPPLEDFFCLTSSEKTIFHFPSLSPLMLSVVFGSEGAKAILDHEQQLRAQDPDRTSKTLLKEELVSLLHTQFPTHTVYDQLIEYLDFAPHHLKQESIIVYDTVTQLQIEKKL